MALFNFRKKNSTEELKERDTQRASSAAAKEVKAEKNVEEVAAPVQMSVPTVVAEHVMLVPIQTEKSVRLQKETNTYVFKVAPSATKGSVALAMKQQYGVTPKVVRIVYPHSKIRQYGRFAGYAKGFKKAYVTVAPGTTLSLTTQS